MPAGPDRVVTDETHEESALTTSADEPRSISRNPRSLQAAEKRAPGRQEAFAPDFDEDFRFDFFGARTMDPISAHFAPVAK